MRTTWPDVAGFESEGMEPQTKRCKQSLQAGKGKQTDSPLEPSGGDQP